MPNYGYHLMSSNCEISNSLLILLNEVGSARLRESFLHPVSLKTPGPQHQPLDRKMRKGKAVQKTRKKSEELGPIKKHWPYSGNSLVPHNRILRMDNERGIKVRWYCKVLQRGDAYVYRCATRAPGVTRTGTYGTGRAPQRFYIGLHLTLDRKSTRLNSSHSAKSRMPSSA